MATYTRPGITSSVSTGQQVPAGGPSGGILFAIGTAPTGTSTPGTVYQSFADFKRDYGDPSGNGIGYTLPLFAQLYFSQSPGFGLQQALGVRRAATVQAAVTLLGATSTSLTLTTKPAYTGTAGNAIAIVVAAASGSTQSITITDANGVIDSGAAYVIPTATPASSLLALINTNSSMFTASAPVDGGAYTTGTFNPTGGADGKGGAIVQADFDALSAVICNGVSAIDGTLATATLLQTHVEAMSASYSKPRIGFAGPALGTSLATIESNTTSLSTADGRMSYAGHAGLRMFNPATKLPVTVDGSYWAAVFAGQRFALPPAEPATWKPVSAVLGPDIVQSASTLDTLSGGGATVVDTGYQGLMTRDSVTTTLAPSTYAKLVNRTAVDEFVARFQRALVPVIGGKGGSVALQLIPALGAQVSQQAVKDGIVDSVQAITPSQTGPTSYSAAVALTIFGEADQISIPIAATVG